MVGFGLSALEQVRSNSRSMVVALVEGAASGPVGDPALSVRAAVSNRLLEAGQMAFVNQQSPHARKTSVINSRHEREGSHSAWVNATFRVESL